jgi:hypothetical protein
MRWLKTYRVWAPVAAGPGESGRGRKFWCCADSHWAWQLRWWSESRHLREIPASMMRIGAEQQMEQWNVRRQ